MEDWIEAYNETRLNCDLDLPALRDNPRSYLQGFLDPERPAWVLRTQRVLGGSQEAAVRWADGRQNYTGFVTILPPNSPSGCDGGDNTMGVYSAGSYHQGGCHVLFADGAVIFVTDSIDAGDSDAMAPMRDCGSGCQEVYPGMESPYGLWGAIGTRAHKETVEEQFNQ